MQQSISRKRSVRRKAKDNLGTQVTVAEDISCCQVQNIDQDCDFPSSRRPAQLTSSLSLQAAPRERRTRVDLPGFLLERLLVDRLERIDITALRLVCKQWRVAVDGNLSSLKPSNKQVFNYFHIALPAFRRREHCKEAVRRRLDRSKCTRGQISSRCRQVLRLAANFSRIKRLDLTREAWSSKEACSALAEMKMLDRLSLWGTFTSVESLLSPLNRLVALKSLELSFTRQVDYDALSGLSELCSLVKLKLCGSLPLHGAQLVALRSCARLKV